jgi:hypothetical protein
MEHIKSYQDYQNELDNLNKQMAELKAKRTELEADLEENGYYVKNNKVQKTEKVWGAIVKWSYYSQYVGEKGSMHDHYQHATTVNDKDYHDIISAYKAKDLDKLDDLLGSNGLIGENFSLIVPKTRYDHNASKVLFDVNGNKTSTSGYVPIPADKIKAQEDRKLAMFTLTDTGLGEELSFRYKGSSDQGETVNDSGFTLGPFSKKYIDNYKSYSEEDDFDGGGMISWEKREF